MKNGLAPARYRGFFSCRNHYSVLFGPIYQEALWPRSPPSVVQLRPRKLKPQQYQYLGLTNPLLVQGDITSDTSPLPRTPGGLLLKDVVTVVAGARAGGRQPRGGLPAGTSRAPAVRPSGLSVQSVTNILHDHHHRGSFPPVRRYIPRP